MKIHYSPLLIVCLAALVTGCSTARTGRVSLPVVPENLKVSPNEELAFAVNAKGVQIYHCFKTMDSEFRWVLEAPEADLFATADTAEKVGRHYASPMGPTWEASDGSKIIGEVRERAASPDTNAIPWLRLSVKKHEGNGVLSRVTSIQRLQTAGGKPPAGGCEQSNAGKELRVPYTAMYYFYVSKP